MIPKIRVWSEERQMMSNVWKITEADDGGVEICSNGFKDGVRSFVYDEPLCAELKPMKSIGRIDKNGDEIFEGDIVEDCYCVLYEVRYNSDFCAFFLYPLENPEEFTEIYPKMELEIIGNIYENPELVGG